MLALTLLGPPHATLSGARQNLRPRRLALLAYLALEGSQGRARLSALLFPELEPDEARSRLRLELHRTLHSPVGSALRTEGEQIALEASCDLLDFEGALRAGQWSAALALSRGELLEGLHFDDAPPLNSWLEARRQQHSAGVIAALEALGREHSAAGHHEEALAVTRELLARQPHSEAACDALTRALEALGRRAEALGEQEQFRERFVRDLGLEPQLTHPLSSPSAVALPAPDQPRPSLREPPLVGREGLFSQLLEWGQHAPAGQILLLIGEGGVGKSRLADSFARQINAPEGGAACTPSLRGFESEQSSPFEAVLEALRRAGAGSLAALEPQWRAELAPLLPEMFVGPPPDPLPGARSRLHPRPQPSEARLLEALSQALRHIVGRSGVVVFEDVHWLDASSVRVFAHTERRLRDQAHSLRFVATARPGELRRNTPLSRWLADLERESRLLRLEVPPLSEVAVLRLIRLLSGSPRATAFAQTLHALSGGNPYALLAFVQGLISRGHLETSAPEGWRLNLALEALSGQLPATLREVLLHTLETQGEAVLRLLEAAALRGQSFEYAAARAGSGLDPATAERALERAVEHRWAVALPEGGYRLEHDLLRQALEANLEPERETAIHLRLAQHLEKGSASSAARAHHWEAGGRRERAFGLWKEAAQEAARLWAHREALHALEHALNCTDDPAERIALHRQRGRHWQTLGQLEPWNAELDAADALERLHPDPGTGLALAMDRVNLLWRENRLEEALALGAPWVQGPLDQDRGLLLHNLGKVLLELGRPQEARTLLEDALGGALERSESEQGSLLPNLHNTLAWVCFDLGDPEGGLMHSGQAIVGFGALHNDQGLASAYTNRACLYELLGDFVPMHHDLRLSLEHAQRAGHSKLIGDALRHLTTLMQDLGQVEEGVAYATQGLEFCEEAGLGQDAAYFAAALEGFRQLRRTLRVPETQVQRPQG